MYKILHISTSLGMGGAETSLYNLLKNTDRSEFDIQVLSLGSDQPVGDQIRSLGIPVVSLGMRPAVPDPLAFIRLTRHLRAVKPDLIQSWLYHADLMAALAARLAGNPPVVWGVHYVPGEISKLKSLTRMIIHLNAFLSHRLPTMIVCDAKTARQAHVHIGYRQDRMVVIPNGFDLETYQPVSEAHHRICAELGLPDSTPVIGMASRFHPDKDHRNFIQAAAILHAQMPDVHYLLWGRDINEHNEVLVNWIDSENLSGKVHLLGFRDDTPMLTAALDVASLSSSSEAFPLALGEAMACGVPCAATDVGDIAGMLDGVGKVVPPRDSSALAQAWLDLLRMPVEERQRLGENARWKVMEQYDIRHTSEKYARLYRDIIEHRQP